MGDRLGWPDASGWAPCCPGEAGLDAYTVDHIEVQENGCWHWTGYVRPAGYGVARGMQYRQSAHRFVYVQVFGPVPDGLTIDHTCHNADLDCPGGVCLHRRCVNPAHLEVCGVRENTIRGKGILAQNLAKTHCPQGHEYTHTDKRGWRKCRTCQRASDNKKRQAAGGRIASPISNLCFKGHELTEENTYLDTSGWRHCRTCRRDYNRARYLRTRGADA